MARRRISYLDDSPIPAGDPHSHSFRCGCEADCDDYDCIRPERLEYRCRFHSRVALLADVTLRTVPIR